MLFSNTLPLSRPPCGGSRRHALSLRDVFPSGQSRDTEMAKTIRSAGPNRKRVATVMIAPSMVFGLLVAANAAGAGAMLCQKPNGLVILRGACKSHETSVGSLGEPGPPGPAGSPGPVGP